jgi:uncharacterized Zn finger protein
MYWGFRPYVSAKERRKKAEKTIAQMLKKGQKVSPVVIEGRTLAHTFWGKAWCRHLESFSDSENRLPRGRTYARNGSIIHLCVEKGKIDALVQGSSLYKIKIGVKPVNYQKWKRILKECSGQIDSVVELLQGKLSSGVMKTITDTKNGLFPDPNEITLNCSCPDWADMCKHVAATLYGIGSRLDTAPELLFKLRDVDLMELITKATTFSKKGKNTSSLKGQNLSDIFGIDLADENQANEKKTPANPGKKQTVSKKSIKDGKRKLKVPKTKNK